MEHLHKRCKYFKGNCQLEESDKKEMSQLKEIRYRFLLETKYLERNQEGVASFTWRGNIFLLTFSSLPSFSFFTFNILFIGSKEQSRSWRVRLEVLGPGGKKGTVRRRTAFEGSPDSIDQLLERKKRKGEVAGVTVGQEMIVKASRGKKAFFDIDLALEKLGVF